MKMKKIWCVVLILFASATVFADWNRGDPYKMHFPQLPNPIGWDICLHEQFIADDFTCTESGPIRDIHFWVSWKENIEDFLGTSFFVQIRSNQPLGPCGGGRPGAVLWTWSSTSGIGNMKIRDPESGQQGWHCPSTQTTVFPDHFFYYQVNITNIPDELAFHQTQGEIYWLVIRANKPEWPPAVGWKTSLNRYMSCSLWSTNGTIWQPVIVDGGVDQAFVITNDGGVHEELDFGDAPDGLSTLSYPTLLASNGARHLLDGVTYMGLSVDAERDGQPTISADGDDINPPLGMDDEDGVVFSPLVIGQLATIYVNAVVPGLLDAWIDFNGDGIWTMGTPEQIAISMPLIGGSNAITFTVPATAILGQTYARFRFSSVGGLSPAGLAPNGEVEDYSVLIEKPTIPEPNKWVQPPDLTETGIDVDATEPFILADDFLCTQQNLITKIIVWGSWFEDIMPPDTAGNVTFTLSIHEDIPDPNPEDPLDYSMPAEPVWMRNFLPGQFEVEVEMAQIDEGWWTPDNPEGYIFPGDHVCWKYTFHIPADEAFYQTGTPENPKVYWLDVQAHTPPDTIARFGWKTSLEHWNDDAVWGRGIEPYMGPWNELIYPIRHVYHPESIDLAFAIDSNNAGPKADLGDAPDSTNSSGAIMTTYPTGVTANFPTVYAGVSSMPPYGPLHKNASAAFWLGSNVSFEKEADTGPDMDIMNNIIPPSGVADMDGGDDGVAVPLSMPRCRLVKFNYTVTVVDVTQPIFANVWFDFNRDGDWDDVNSCGTDAAAEWAVVDQFLTFSAPGTYTVSTPVFRTWHPTADDSPIWMRISLSETPSAPTGAGGSGPLGGYEYGETEDYYFTVDQSCSSCADYDLSGQVDYLDLREFVADWLWSGLPGGYAEGDLDCNGDVEFTDFAIFALQWLSSCP